MSEARRELTLEQITYDLDALARKVSHLQCEVSKLLHVVKTLSTCIKSLWMVIAPIASGLALYWFKS